MENKIPKKRMDEIVSEVMQNHVSDVRVLLTNNGVINASKFNDDDTRLAFLKAIKDSASFRSDLANYMANLVTEEAAFVQQPALDFVSQNYSLNFGSDDPDTGSPAYATTTTPTATTTATKSGFWGALGGLASKDNLQSLFNTGLQVGSNALQNSANKSSEERALELERLRLQQIQAQKDLQLAGGGTAAKKGLSTGAWIGIGVGGLVLITVIVLIARKK